MTTNGLPESSSSFKDQADSAHETVSKFGDIDTPQENSDIQEPPETDFNLAETDFDDPPPGELGSDNFAL